jgi:hypothetical protein
MEPEVVKALSAGVVGGLGALGAVILPFFGRLKKAEQLGEEVALLRTDVARLTKDHDDHRNAFSRAADNLAGEISKLNATLSDVRSDVSYLKGRSDGARAVAMGRQ